jgi:Cof subfamily protein (haloacid dehalogenase superfamily)
MNPSIPHCNAGRIELLALDLDGTLLQPDGTITDRALDALKAARGIGITIVAATGRPPMMLGPVTERIGHLLDYAVGSNGTMVARFPGAELMRLIGFSACDARSAIETLRARDPQFGFALATDAGFAHEPGFAERMPVGLGSEPVDDVLTLGGDEAYKLMVFHPAIGAHRLVEDLPPMLTETLTVSHMGADAAELGPAGVDKGTGLAWLCEEIGIDAEAVLACGDDWNDLTMLAWSGWGIAMANAEARVRSRADQVIAANTDDAVAQMIEQLVARRS